MNGEIINYECDSSIDSINEILNVAEWVLENDYYRSLSDLPVSIPESMSLDNISEKTWLYKIAKLSYGNEELNIADKLKAIAGAVNMCGGSLVMLIERKEEITLSIGVVDNTHQTNITTIKNSLESSLTGNFPGSIFAEYSIDNITEKLTDIYCREDTNNCITAISACASDSNNFYKGIDEFLNSTFNSQFTMMIIADPVAPEQIRCLRKNYEDISTMLSQFINVVRSNSISNGEDISSTTSFTSGTSYSNAKAESYGETLSRSQTNGKSIRENQNNKFTAVDFATIGASLASFIAAGIDPKLAPLVTGVISALNNLNNMAKMVSQKDDISKNDSSTQGTSYQKNFSETESKSYSESETQGISKSNSFTNTDSLQYTVINRTAKRLYDKVERKLQWLEQVENYGMFGVSTYILSDSVSTNMVVASHYETLLNGEKTGNIYGINTWTDSKAEDIKKSLMQFTHPRFSHPQLKEISSAVLISSHEMARHLALPKNSVNGISVINYNTFGRNVTSKLEPNIHDTLNIGKINFLGKDIPDSSVLINIDSLSGHTFVAGANRTGKSTAIFSLLNKIRKKGIPFLVIEPAKGEYKKIFTNVDDVSIYSPMVLSNSPYNDILPFSINIFYFCEGIDPNEHIEKMTEIFSAAFPMYAAMPQVLKEALYMSYENCGWNLETSENPYGRIFPTISELCENIKFVIDKTDFSSEVKGNYIGSLLTRIQSFDKGIYKRVFSTDIGDEQLFEKNTIIDLSRPDTSDFKSLIMGFIIIRLSEYCMAKGEFPENSALMHLTILEEAHVLLAPTVESSENANISLKSIEMITRCIAELGGFGRGFIISDQSPGLINRAVIRNTNTKIVFRLPDMNDCELCGKSMGLTQEQYFEFSRLERGVCSVHQINWLEAVLCHIEPHLPTKKINSTKEYKINSSDFKEIYINALLTPFSIIGKKIKLSDTEINTASEAVSHIICPGKIKITMISALKNPPNYKKSVEIISEIYSTDLLSDCREDLSYFTKQTLKNINISSEIISLTLIEFLLEVEKKYTDNSDFRDKWFEFIKPKRN